MPCSRIVCADRGLKAVSSCNVIADAHIYDRHVPAITEIIPRRAPRFVIDPTVDDFISLRETALRSKTTSIPGVQDQDPRRCLKGKAMDAIVAVFILTGA